MKDFLEGMRDVFIGIGNLCNFFKWDANDFYVFGAIFACILIAFGIGVVAFVIF